MRYRSSDPVDRLTILISSFYLMEISAKLIRDSFALGLIKIPYFTWMLFIPNYVGRISRICQLC